MNRIDKAYNNYIQLCGEAPPEDTMYVKDGNLYIFARASADWSYLLDEALSLCPEELTDEQKWEFHAFWDKKQNLSLADMPLWWRNEVIKMLKDAGFKHYDRTN